MSDRPDAFGQFATECGLRLSWIDVNAAPRDVTAPPDELERFALVTVSGKRADAAPLQTLFVSDRSDPTAPSMRDVLWWLSSDSWAIEHADREVAKWSAVYGYREESPATARLFRLHVAQADSLQALLGAAAYRELLALYQAELKSH